MSWSDESHPALRPWEASGYIRLTEGLAGQASPLSDTLANLVDNAMPTKNFWQDFIAEQESALMPVTQFESIGQQLAASMGIDKLHESLLSFDSSISEQLQANLGVVMKPPTIISYLESINQPALAASEAWKAATSGALFSANESISSWMESFKLQHSLESSSLAQTLFESSAVLREIDVETLSQITLDTQYAEFVDKILSEDEAVSIVATEMELRFIDRFKVSRPTAHNIVRVLVWFAVFGIHIGIAYGIPALNQVISTVTSATGLFSADRVAKFTANRMVPLDKQKESE